MRSSPDYLPLFVNDDRLSETARRAGIAIFLAVTAASAVLVYAAFHNDFSVAYILHHSNRALPAPYKFAALWSGQEGSLLFWCWLLAAYGLVLRLRHKVDTRLVAHASVVISAVQIFFLGAGQFCRASVRAGGRHDSRRRQRTQSAAAVSGDGHPSAHALSGLCRDDRAVLLRAGRAHHALPRRKVDSHHPALDDGGLAVSHLRNLPRLLLGLPRPGLGRLVGMGPGRECIAAAVVDRYRLSCTR